MTSRELPVIFVTMLVLGASFTFAINSMLGGTVRTAPPRVAPSDDSTLSPQISPPDQATAVDYPKEAGNPRLWRSSSTEARSRDRRAEGRSSRRPRRNSTSTVSAPTQTAPAPSAPSSPGPASSPPSASPQPAPSPEPEPKTPRSNGGGDFYNSG